MIGKLRGTIDSYGEDFVILDVNGVGYLVHCSGRTLQALPRAGEALELAIETHVREDQIRLFGFATATEREWFRLLQTVQGIGTKVALAVLSTLKPGDLANAIAMRDRAAIVRAPGVGAKVAERILTELKDKAPALADVDPAVVRLSGALDERSAPQPSAMPSRPWSISAMASRRPRRQLRRRRGRPMRRAKPPTRRNSSALPSRS